MIAELQRLKAGIEKAQSQYDMRKGQLQSVIDTLKEKGFSSIKELQDKSGGWRRRLKSERRSWRPE